MKLAKNENRNLLQKAWDFVKESKPNSRIGLFHWKFKEHSLKNEEIQKILSLVICLISKDFEKSIIMFVSQVINIISLYLRIQ